MNFHRGGQQYIYRVSLLFRSTPPLSTRGPPQSISFPSSRLLSDANPVLCSTITDGFFHISISYHTRSMSFRLCWTYTIPLAYLFFVAQFILGFIPSPRFSGVDNTSFTIMGHPSIRAISSLTQWLIVMSLAAFRLRPNPKLLW